MADSVDRKLRAILCADVKGYSRMMGEDEVGTYQTLTVNLELIRFIITEHKGRVFSSPGDAVMAEFSSVVDAVQCAVELQEKIEAANTEVPEDKKMQFRIGINLGDVIHDGEQVYGDGVNIAARIETLAKPGGVSISRTVYDHVYKKLKFGYEYHGEHQVKNIAEPVSVYKVLTAPEQAGQLIGDSKAPKHLSKQPYISIFVVLALIAVAVIWQFYLRAPEIEPASVKKMAQPLPDKPSIAVLLFDNMSGDPKQEYLSDGFTEDLITTISKIPELFVISRQSTSTYKGKSVKVQTVAEDLGVRYVLEGSIQKSGDQLRVNVQLIDAIKGHHLWSERYDRKFDKLFKLKDDIIFKVANELLAELITGDDLREIISTTDRPKPWQTNNLEAWETYWLAQKSYRRYRKEGNARARDLFTKAYDLDPNWYIPLIMVGWTHQQDARMGYSESRKKSFEQAAEIARRVIDIYDQSATAHNLLGSIHLYSREFEKAKNYFDKALSVNPNAAYIQAAQGSFLSYLTKPQEAIVHFKKAMRLSPFYPAWYLSQLGVCYHLNGEYEKAIETLKKAIEREPDKYFQRVRLVAVCSDLGREQEAHTEAAEVLRIKPDFSIEAYARANPYRDQAVFEHRKELLRKAGLPD